jgi:hypothetical protein
MPRGPAARELLLSCAAALFSAAALGQTSSPAFQDIIPGLATRIAAAIAPIDRIRVTVHDDAASVAERESMQRAFVEALAVHGVVLGDSPGAASASLTCSEHIRGRICAADVRTGGTQYAIVEERRDDDRGGPAPYVPMVLTLEPLFAQASPILDAALVGSRLIVLDPASVTEYERASSGWRPRASRPIEISAPRPRDVRGRLRVDGAGLDVYLPGTACRGALDPLALSCTADQRAWPIGIDNDGIAAGRNLFEDRRSAAFVSAAPLGVDAGARWLVVSSDRGWVLMDDDHRQIDVPGRDRPDDSALRGDDVAALTTGCAPGTHVIGSERTTPTANGVDALRLVRIAGRRLTPIGPPAILDGRITALWTADPGRALVVTRREPGTYEAFFATVSCGR